MLYHHKLVRQFGVLMIIEIAIMGILDIVVAFIRYERGQIEEAFSVWVVGFISLGLLLFNLLHYR